ncbi:MAG: M48 family metallopeptidase [Bdellovibrionaceae bacterium]|nr:M48 family metallopeptidase [Pseudobdellovibrionaceae bacterium]
MKNTILLLVLVLSSCASTTQQGAIGVNRKQFLVGVSADQVNQASLQAYNEVTADATKKKTLDTNVEQVRRVKAVATRLIPHTAVFRKDAPSWAWETHVINSDEVNAYCMPGGKIVFYSGIIEKLKMTDGEIAAVMGHEIAHALREHGRERMAEANAQQLLTGAGLAAVAASGKVSEQNIQLIRQGATVAATIAFILPHSRDHESEADDIGVELMARAGYDPQEAVNLWKKMAVYSGGNKPMALLSTHPADDKRIADITALLPKVNPLYNQATKP